MENIVENVSKLSLILGDLSGEISISLPRIAVVGQQSSGKSSVLEGIIGKDIIPRSSGLCTRVPLILSITNNPDLKNNLHGSFSHFNQKENIKFQSNDLETNIKFIRNEIIRKTDELTGPNEIKNKPIILNVSSSNLPNLSLIDLPGLTKISVAGQSANVVKDIDSMIREYISQESTIILAVVPANSDLANSDSLSIAQEYDPEGKRTIGIVTKLDLMDHGTSAIKILKNEEFFLKLGYIGVVNRGQNALNNNEKFEQAEIKANNFFESHPEYSEIADKCGFSYLKKRLGEVFANHVNEKLPKLFSEIVEIQKNTEIELKKYNTDNKSTLQKIQSAVSDFVRIYDNYINGKIPFEKNKTLFGGSRIKEMLVKNLDSNFDSQFTESEINNAVGILNIKSMGIQSNLVFGDQAFIKVTENLILQFDNILISSTNHAIDELKILIQTAIKDSKIINYPLLYRELIAIVDEKIRERQIILMKKIKKNIEIESNHINIDHPFFYDLPLKLFHEVSENTSKSIEHHQRMIKIQNDVTKKLVYAYLQIVLKQSKDFLIKVTQKELIYELGTYFTEFLISEIASKDKNGNFVEEKPEIAEVKKKLQKRLGAVNSALELLEKMSFI